MNIYFIGYRCSGKTSIGEKLSLKLGVSFFDLDSEISNFYSISIFNMVTTYGWDYFRCKEKTSFVKVAIRRSEIISPGGGIVVDNINVLLMKSSGILIWLKTKVSDVKNFILSDKNVNFNRISLTGNTVLKDIFKTFEERKFMYNRVFDLSFFTFDFDFDLICDYIIYFIQIKT